jgi:hypothetical protein
MTNSYNPMVAKLTVPPRLRALPVDERGYPVPKFVAWVDGKPDFRVVDNRYRVKATRQRLCWLCGGILGRHLAFVIGPMCAVNRISSEPPSHLECARFSVQACPFLTQPKRVRDKRDLPEDHEKPAGFMIERNPGVSLIWVTSQYRLMKEGGGVLFQIGEPTSTEWWTRGRTATREEVMESMATGLPALRDMATEEGPAAVQALEKQIARGLALVPAA